MSTFYRLEAKNGLCGVYFYANENDYVNDILEKSGLLSSSDSSPMPNDDIRLVESFSERNISNHILHTESVKFGFTSKRKLLMWFNKRVLKQLVKHAVIIIEATIDDARILKGGYQDVVLTEDYKKCEKRSLTLDEFLSDV